MDIYLGFDPGGKKNFGWAVCSSAANTLRVLNTGTARHSAEAMAEVEKALSNISEGDHVVGAGIDAPLLWVENGRRKVDELLQTVIGKLGAPSPYGTVQHINSLWGACIVQGVMLANLLHRRFPALAITESHPKALLYLLGIANAEKEPGEVTIADLAEHVSYDNECVSEHERDAILGALTAFAQNQKLPGWRNLLEDEEKPVIPFRYQPSYWMPWDLVKE